MNPRRVPAGAATAALAVLLVAVVGLAVACGDVRLSLAEVGRAVLHRAIPAVPAADDVTTGIVWDLRLPRALVYPLALAAEGIARVTQREPFVTLDGLRMAKYKMFFTSTKAERELGYTWRPVDEALRDAVQWFRAMGRVP